MSQNQFRGQEFFFRRTETPVKLRGEARVDAELFVSTGPCYGLTGGGFRPRQGGDLREEDKLAAPQSKAGRSRSGCLESQCLACSGSKGRTNRGSRTGIFFFPKFFSESPTPRSYVPVKGVAYTVYTLSNIVQIL